MLLIRILFVFSELNGIFSTFLLRKRNFQLLIRYNSLSEASEYSRWVHFECLLV